jgi:hypothetical protein
VSKESVAPETASVTLPGTVDKVIKSPDPSEPDKAQIVVEGAGELYREIRINNALQTDKGEEVALKPGTVLETQLEFLGHLQPRGLRDVGKVEPYVFVPEICKCPLERGKHPPGVSLFKRQVP